MHLLFIINPAAGAGQKNITTTIRQWLNDTETGYSATVHELPAKEDCTGEIRALLKQHSPQRVIAAGGDGTIKLLAGILAGTGIPLAILPTGSANGMATELGLPTNITAALELAVFGKERPTDLIQVNKEWCIHLSDIGLNALLLQYFEAIPQRGMLGYARAFFNMLWQQKQWKRLKLLIQVDGRTFRRKAFMAILANATKYGTGAVINPGGKINDGLFELVVIKKLPVGEIVKILFTRKPFNPWNIEVIPCKNLVINSQTAAPFQIDGEFRGSESRVEATIVPGTLLLVYPDHPA